MFERNSLMVQAKFLRTLLEKYSLHDDDVKEAYQWIEELLKKVDAGCVVNPTQFDLGWIFFRGENNLLSYPDLCNAVADFVCELEGRR